MRSHFVNIDRDIPMLLPPDMRSWVAADDVAQDTICAFRRSNFKAVSVAFLGVIKQAMGFRQFLLRGLEKVDGEWKRVCLAYNMKRLGPLIRA